MHRSQLAAAAACAMLILLCAAPGGARAARVTFLGRGGHARVMDDRFVPAAPASVPSAQVAVSARRRSSSQGVTVVSRLAQLARLGQITTAQHSAYLNQFESALRTQRRLRGTRATELEAVIETLHSIAASRQLSASRLAVLFLTLERNVQWWTTGPLLTGGTRVEFAGSQLVWKYYPGQGIELQQLASFGKADGLYTAGRARYRAMEALLGELIPLAARRAGGIAWEYYFSFGGGAPPWVSAMTQGTALEALTRAYKATHDPTYLQIAHSALPLLSTPPPAGVAVPTSLGTRFLQYSFTPGTDIINAFLQALIGLHDYAHVSRDPVAASLFTAGDIQAQAELPRFDTGAWSLYQPGLEDDLSYHELVTGFLQLLCAKTRAPIYCQTAAAFRADETTPPTLTQMTTSVAAGPPAGLLRFRLSKISHTGIVVTGTHGTMLATSASFPYGVGSFALPSLPRGTYTVHLSATDLAGNFSRITGMLTVTRRPAKHHS